jgi:hypothetical protein
MGMEQWWNDTDRKKTKYVLKEKPVPVPLCPPKIPHGLALETTQTSAVTGWHLTT